MVKNRSWDLKKRIREIEKYLNSHSFSNVAAFVDKKLAADCSPQVYAGVLDYHLAVWEFHVATRAILCGSNDAANWSRLHLGVRYCAAQTKIYLDRFDQLAAESPDDAKRGRLRIARWHSANLNAELFTLMAAIALGEWLIAKVCGRRVIRSYTAQDSLVAADCWSDNPCDLFMLYLIAILERLPDERAEFAKNLADPYDRIDQAWNDDSEFESAVNAIVQYHGANCDGSESLFLHPYDVFPAEILALKTIRSREGLSFPPLIDLPIMQTPLARVPENISPVTDDPYIPRVIELCRKTMTVDIPWES
ncbi:MAG: hypothetical protein JSS02_05990 [Planctomycetes bacterium]|nr:hypothetical protein [Planctomycetota bacterium]